MLEVFKCLKDFHDGEGDIFWRYARDVIFLKNIPDGSKYNLNFTLNYYYNICIMYPDFAFFFFCSF